MSKRGYETGSRNVFKDLGLRNADEHFVKAQLVFKIDTLMMFPRCCAASSGSFPSSAFCAFSWRSIRMLKSW